MSYIELPKNSNDDERKFLHDLERRIKGGDVYAMEQWATFFSYNHPELATPDIARKCITYYEMAISIGDSRAMLNLGAMYYNGTIIPQDFEKAVKLYTMAADSQDRGIAAKAIGNLGYCYYYGRSVAVDKEKAFSFFLKGVLQYTDPICLYKLGDMYRYGDIVCKDKQMAYLCYIKAQEHCSYCETNCSADIYKRLGECKLYGIGTERDVLASIKDLTRAKAALYDRIYVKKDSFAGNLMSKIEKLIREAENLLKKDVIA